MVFSSLTFLFFFFPLVFIVYFLVKPWYANLWLFLASIYFYYAGAGAYVWLIICVITVAYFSGLFIHMSQRRIVKQLVLFTALVIMLGLLIYYKYWDFIIGNINKLGTWNFAVKDLVLPVGLSFFTFQAISYIVDIFRGEKPLKNPIDMGLYISFFPQLIAGPIVRYQDIRAYMKKACRKVDLGNLAEGAWRFGKGLSKKVLLANNLGGLADIVFGVRDISRFSVLYTWLGAVAYTLQIYYDFSGYSDMAIGLGRMFGFRFLENFDHPYTARSIREFWRRWHISLYRFFRDYVYIPLGGSRCAKGRWIFNTLLVWFLTGLWHGASWKYVFWGLSYGVILLAERHFAQGGGRFPAAQYPGPYIYDDDSHTAVGGVQGCEPAAGICLY